jgi:peptidoglycan hydrolase-like protein with peptidoglycan-binding domain
VAPCGIDRVDDLLAGNASVPLKPGDKDRQSVAVVQDLLTGHGQRGLPNLLSPNYGVFGPATAAAVRKFRKQQNLGDVDEVDCATLKALVLTPAVSPIASRAYITLVLGFPYSGLARVLSVVAQMEGAGRFAALNLNTDCCGLSFGLIQWAQKPGRLADILCAFQKASQKNFVEIFGAGSPSLCEALLAHARKSCGGVDAKSGKTTDPAFDLTREPWVSRFRRAALWVPFQKVQVETALAAFQESCEQVRKFAPEIQSEEGTAFMIDIANQFGNGGARKLCQAARRDGMNEQLLMQAVAAESVRRMQEPFKASTDARRKSFLAINFLSDTPFANVVGGEESA